MIDESGESGKLCPMEVVPWNKEFVVQDGRYRAFRIGDLCIVIAKLGSEWHVAYFREQMMPFPEEGAWNSLTRDLSWIRWEASYDDNQCMIRPALPTLPVISRPTLPVTLSPGSKARFFMGVPAYVEVYARCNQEYLVMASYPMVAYSYTWMGVSIGDQESTTEGEICMALETKARRSFDEEVFQAGSIICSVEISNHGSKQLPFSRLRLDTDHLSIHLTNTRAWASYCRFDVYDGGIQNSIFYADTPPLEAGDSILIAKPRFDAKSRQKKLGALDMIVDKFKLNI